MVAIRRHKVFANINEILDRLERASPAGKLLGQLMQGLLRGRIEYFPIWETLTFPASLLAQGIPNPPDWVTAGLNDIYVLAFDHNTNEEVHITASLPHSWKASSFIIPQIHLININAGAGDIVWKIEYSIAENGEIFPAPATIITSIQAIDEDQYSNIKHTFPVLDLSDYTFAPTVIIRMFRDASNELDTYGSPIGFLSTDLHILKDSIGSDESDTKPDLI